MFGLMCAGHFVSCTATNALIDWDDETITSKTESTWETTSFMPFTSTTEVPTNPTTVSTTTIPTTVSTTSIPTTVSTTPIPTTLSTTTIPTTTTTAKPNPPSTTGAWTVVDELTNITCVVLKMAASFVIPYKTDLGERNATVVLPNNATSNGSCTYLDDKHQGITIKWPADDASSYHFNFITFTFERNQSHMVDNVHEDVAKAQYFVSNLKMHIFADSLHFPNSSKTPGFEVDGNLDDLLFYPTNINSSYRCNSEYDVRIKVGVFADQTALVRFTHVQMEAFRSLENDKFNVASDCSADDILTSDIVPIAVGCALAALVVVVLIAYLIGRRRARQRGYQSV